MIKKELLEKYAKLAVKIGANVQKGQLVGIMASTENRELVREVVKQAYEAGASRVIVRWTDEYVGRYGFDYRSIESLEDIPTWFIDQAKYFVDQGGCIISISSPVPDIFNGVDPKKLQAAGIANSKALQFFMNYMMSSKGQWTIIAAPNKVWAKKIFPDLDEDKAEEALWNAILETSRVNEDTDPIDEWNKHNQELFKHNKILSDFKFDKLHFKNKLGTDIEIKLVEHHIWVGGAEYTTKNVLFNPNIPTEENFTMPHRDGVNGKVFATKPLNYQGKLIDDFWVEFKDGKVVDYDAKKNKDALENILNTDEGAKHLGEIALISYDSPISNMDILFYNTLFDENASCHMALGRAIPFSIKGGSEMELKDLQAKGYNHSMVHVDFMFGSPDLSVIGITKDGKEIEIFKNGNFVI